MDVERFDRPGFAALVRDGEVDVKTLAGLALAGLEHRPRMTDAPLRDPLTRIG